MNSVQWLISENYFHVSSQTMPLLSLTTTRSRYQRSVSLTSYVHNDIKLFEEVEADVNNNDKTEAVIDIDHVRDAVTGQKKIVKKSISSPAPSDLSGQETRLKRGSCLHEFRKVSSNELLPAFSDHIFAGPILIDVRLSRMISSMIFTINQMISPQDSFISHFLMISATYLETVGGGKGWWRNLHCLSEEGSLQHPLAISERWSWRSHISPGVGDGEGEVHEGGHPGEAGGESGQRHRGVGVNLHQCLPGHLQNLCLRQASAQSSDRAVSEKYFCQIDKFP